MCGELSQNVQKAVEESIVNFQSKHLKNLFGKFFAGVSFSLYVA